MKIQVTLNNNLQSNDAHIISIGMKLISASKQTKTFSDLTEFQRALNTTDFVIDESPKSAFKDLSFDSWLTAANFSPSSEFSFISGKAVYRTDGLVNINGYSGK